MAAPEQYLGGPFSPWDAHAACGRRRKESAAACSQVWPCTSLAISRHAPLLRHAPLWLRARVRAESFYRSGLNAAMNARLSGQWGTLFPNMHIQCPARILYINGFKGLRQYLDWKVSLCL